MFRHSYGVGSSAGATCYYRLARSVDRRRVCVSP